MTFNIIRFITSELSSRAYSKHHQLQCTPKREEKEWYLRSHKRFPRNAPQMNPAKEGEENVIQS
jgi:hypothetical protein